MSGLTLPRSFPRSLFPTAVAGARIGVAALMLFALFPSVEADARPGRGLSVGSRGVKTYTPPPSTNTAPGTAQPMQRSATPSEPSRSGPSAAAQAGRPTAAAAASQSRFGTGFMAGLLGAGLFGALLGAGLFGNLGSLTAILGFVLQLALIAGVVYLVVGYFRRNRQPTAAGPGAPRLDRDVGRDMYREPVNVGGGNDNNRPASRGVRIGSAAGPLSAAATGPLNLTESDFTSFERLLAVVQTAYGREDVDALQASATDEMVGYLREEIDANVTQGVRNELGEPRLLSGDLSEAWAEAGGEYATVAMRYALTDVMVNRTTGAVVSGDRNEPVEVTEVWTFTRRPGSGPSKWRLAAIQQVA